MTSDLSIQDLQRRVLAYANQCVATGLISETRLGAKIGVSQSHMHHILAGKRGCTSETADAIVRALNLSALDLYTVDELRSLVEDAVQNALERINNPFLTGPEK